MLSIQEQLLYSTLRIECLDKDQNLIMVGTGFLLSRTIEDKKVKIYLVSNKHILMCADKISLSFTQRKGEEAEHGTIVQFLIEDVKTNVVGHPNVDVDVAVLECTGFFTRFLQQLYIKTVPVEMISDFNETELTVAENVLFVGYPDDRYDKVNNLPLVRQGLIASHPKRDYNGKPIFIIDAQVFPGSSGSPVFIDLTYENMKNGVIEVGTRKMKLLGVVASTMVCNNQLTVIPAGFQLTAREVIGLGIVYKAYLIKDILAMMPVS